MAKVLRDLLDAEEPIFSLSLQQLERASGRHGTDARLIGEIAEKMHKSVASLGLDGKDTTDEELHSAMMGRMKDEWQRF